MRFLLIIHKALEALKKFDFIGIFLLRLYLFYIFWYAGTGKISYFDKFSGYLGSADIDSLGLPFADILTWLIIATEAGGAILILVGLFVRWVTIPLLTIMVAAVFLVHWENGWAQESNGIEMAITYSSMLVILLFSGGGKFLSLDYWISKK